MGKSIGSGREELKGIEVNVKTSYHNIMDDGWSF